MLRTPQRDELPELSELCMISKAHWENNEAFMDTRRVELTITEEEGVLP